MWIMMHKTEVFPLRKWWLVFMLYFLSFSSMYYQNFCVPLKTVSEIDAALLSNHRMNRLGFKTLRFLVSPSSISHVRAIYSASSLFASIDGRRVAQTQVRGPCGLTCYPPLRMSKKKPLWWPLSCPLILV